MKLENKTVEELKNMCRNKKISGYSKLNKQGIINLLINNKKVKKVKKGGYFPKELINYNRFSIWNKTYGATKNNLADNYYNSFVPFQEYNINKIIKNNQVNNNLPKTLINKLIYRVVTNSLEKKINEKKIVEYLYNNNYIQTTSLPNNNNRKKMVCNWWCIVKDNESFKWKQIKGTLLPNSIFCPLIKDGVPTKKEIIVDGKIIDYECFIMTRYSSWI